MVNEQIVNEFMAKVGWSAGIDYVSGALSKPSKSGQHSCEKMLLGTHRVAATTSSDCNRVYIRRKVKRSTPAMADELAARARFTAVSRAVRLRAKDLMQINADQQAFLAQRDTANGKNTMKSYLWMLEGAKYDSEHGNG
jgi:hypothetical protein